ncbi:hypothetical protein Strvi_9486 (plasmid) [Streptomyces violaceusniger Tu 4113]|uniref:Uncharacterized protein n=1 Tax=Streptomyces violaceusniger (strain Tu 4113) TaxID=653045 RepID=G2PH91_STRV4|nr:hypothetical protein Strvi_9486 [Streptomyces violaceusniger Tu 4113]
MAFYGIRLEPVAFLSVAVPVRAVELHDHALVVVRWEEHVEPIAAVRRLQRILLLPAREDELEFGEQFRSCRETLVRFRQHGQPCLPMNTCATCADQGSCRAGHSHQTGTLAPAVTSAGVRVPFRDGCHSAAISGLSIDSAW